MEAYREKDAMGRERLTVRMPVGDGTFVYPNHEPYDEMSGDFEQDEMEIGR